MNLNERLRKMRGNNATKADSDNMKTIKSKIEKFNSIEDVGNGSYSSEPIVSEPDSPEVMSEASVLPKLSKFQPRFNSQRSISANPMLEKRIHSTSSYHTSNKRREEILETSNGVEVKSLKKSSARSDSASNIQEQVETKNENGEIVVDTKKNFFKQSQAKASLEAVDSLGNTMKQAAAAMKQSSGAQSAKMIGNGTDFRPIASDSQWGSRTLRAAMEATPDGKMRGTIVGDIAGDPEVFDESAELMDRIVSFRIDCDNETSMKQLSENGSPYSLSHMLEDFWSQMEQNNEVKGLPVLTHRMRNEGMLDQLINFVDSDKYDDRVKVLSMKVLGQCADDPLVVDQLSEQNEGIKSIIKFASSKGNVESRQVGTGLLEKMFHNSEDRCSRIVDSGGLEAVLEASRSPDTEIRRNCALALLNLSMFGGSENCTKMVKQRAQEWLYPLAFDQTDLCTKYLSCLTIGVLISYRELEACIAKSQTLDLVDEFVNFEDVETVAKAYRRSEINGKQSKELLKRLASNLDSRIPQAQQLAAFHFAVVSHTLSESQRTQFFRETGAIEKLKWCATYPNQRAAKFAIEALSSIHEGVPFQLTQQVPLWTVESARRWCSMLGFRPLLIQFSEHEIDGDILLQLDEETLQKDLGVTNSIKRKRFLRELQHLRTLSDYSSVDTNKIRDFLRSIGPEYTQYTYNFIKSGVDHRTLPLLTDENLKNDAGVRNGIHRLQILEALRRRYTRIGGSTTDLSMQSASDIFISYRRATGSQLASLLKVHLQLRGFSVFIDIERLEAGAFDQKLLESIRVAKHFVLVLSSSALDRCIGDDDKRDWIHKEITAAIEHNCNIVPIIDSEFDWPKPEALPEDMRQVCKFNGVRWIHDYQDACVDKLERFLQGELNMMKK